MSAAPPIPIPPGGLRTNEDEARWLEQTILLRTEELLTRAGVTARIAPTGLYDLLLLCLDAASNRGSCGGTTHHSDDRAVDMFARAVKRKLTASREKGRSGWENCSSDELWNMFDEHRQKGDPVDLGNFAMFLWHVKRFERLGDRSEI